MTCDKCGGSEQVVSTQDGSFCRSCYRGYKAGKSMGRAVLEGDPPERITCGNCFTQIAKGSPRCFMCGNYLNSSGDVLRIGGHADC